MAMREGASRRILTGETDGCAIKQERAEGKRFAQSPINPGVFGYRLSPSIENRLQLLVHMEIRRNSGRPFGDLTETLDRYRGCSFLSRPRSRETGPGPTRLVRFVGTGRSRMNPSERFLQRVVSLGLNPLRLFSRDAAGIDQLLKIEGLNGFLLANLSVEPRLCERRLVALVMSVPAITNEINYDVVAEALAISHRQLRHVDDRFRVITVHMKDRDLDHLGDVCAVERRASFRRRRRVADLVVDDHVDRAARAVPHELREVEGLGNDPLAGESCIAVQDHRNDRLAVGVSGSNLLCLSSTFDHGIHRFEMRRIRGQREVNALATFDATIG